MFQPASLKGDSPTPIDERIRNKYLILYFLIILASFFPCSIFEYYYFIYIWGNGLFLIFFLGVLLLVPTILVSYRMGLIFSRHPK